MQKKDKVSRSSDNYLTCLMNPGHLWGWKKIIANREWSNKLEKSTCNPGLETALATATANFLVILWASGCLSVCTLSSQLLCLTPGCPFSPTCFPHFICQRSFPGRKPTLVTWRGLCTSRVPLKSRVNDPTNLNPIRRTGQKYKERAEEGLLKAVAPMASLESADKLLATLLPYRIKSLEQ